VEYEYCTLSIYLCAANVRKLPVAHNIYLPILRLKIWKLSWPNLKRYPRIFLRGLRKTTEDLRPRFKTGATRRRSGANNSTAMYVVGCDPLGCDAM
jgi:hypothetical protein